MVCCNCNQTYYARLLFVPPTYKSLIVFEEFFLFSDLQKKKIRTVGKAEQRFEEDPLRKLRALRFQARLGGTFDKNESLSDVYFAKVFVKKFEGVEIRSIYLKDLPSADSLGNSYLNYPYVFPLVIQNGDTLLGSQYWSSKTQLPIQFYNTPNM